MKLSKQDLVAQLIEKAQDGVEILATAAESSRQDSIQAEGRMQTRYGCSKELNGYLADGLNARVSQRANDVGRLRSLRLPQDPFSVQEGCLVRLEDVEGERFVDYFVLPCCGGENLETGNGELTVVTPESPIGKAMFGLGFGDPFSVTLGNGEKQYRVANIT